MHLDPPPLPSLQWTMNGLGEGEGRERGKGGREEQREGGREGGKGGMEGGREGRGEGRNGGREGGKEGGREEGGGGGLLHAKVSCELIETVVDMTRGMELQTDVPTLIKSHYRNATLHTL